MTALRTSAPAPLRAWVLDQVRTVGYAVVTAPHDDRSFASLAGELGAIIDDVRVEIVPGDTAYLAQPGEMPFHTDHPLADIIGWRCEVQDEGFGASLLVDGRAVLAALDARRRRDLAGVQLPARRGPGEAEVPTPIVTGEDERLFFTPWLRPLFLSWDGRFALAAFRDALAHAPHALEVRLAPGELLFIDNHRMLHGRGPLPQESKRRLRRLWIHRPEAST